MAAEKIAYSDPTAQMLQVLTELGGTKGTTTTSVTGNPAGAAGLQQILDQQLRGITPEGATALLQAIFQGGMEQVPGLATTYAQAAGARTKSNSPMQLALQDLFVKLTQEAAKQLSTNQANASQTAERLANSSRTETKNATSQPKASAMQLLPFALANVGKLKGLKDAVTGIFGGSSGTSASPFNVGQIFSGGGVGGGYGFGAPDFGGIPSAIDFGATEPVADLFGSAMSSDVSFAEPIDFGGGYDTGGFEDVGSYLGGSAGFSDLPPVDFGGFDGGGFEDIGDIEFFANGGLVSRKNSLRKAPGYADGGQVRRRKNFADATGNNLVYNPNEQLYEGFNYTDDGRNLSQLLMRALQHPSSNAGSRGGINTGRKQRKEYDDTTPDGGDGQATTSTTIGTPAENQAAMNSFAIGLASAVLGVPAFALNMAAKSLNVPTKSVEPIPNIINYAINAIGGSGSNSGLSPASVSEATGIAGANNGGLAGLGVSLGLDQGFDPADPTGASIGFSVDTGISGAGAGGGTSGGTDGVGDAAGAGVGGGGFKSGGEIDGPGGPRDDLIPIQVSDGEYVMNANSVNMFGVEFFDMLNAVGLQQKNVARGKQPMFMGGKK